MSEKPIDVSQADWQARCFVNGAHRNSKTDKFEPLSGQWSSRFADHPWVQQADREGWARDLRQVVIYAVKRRILERQPFDPIELVMPGADWIEATRKQAAKYAASAQWREQVIAEHGSVDAFLQKSAKANNGAVKGWKKLGDAA